MHCVNLVVSTSSSEFPLCNNLFHRDRVYAQFSNKLVFLRGLIVSHMNLQSKCHKMPHLCHAVTECVTRGLCFNVRRRLRFVWYTRDVYSQSARVRRRSGKSPSFGLCEHMITALFLKIKGGCNPRNPPSGTFGRRRIRPCYRRQKVGVEHALLEQL